MSRNVGREFLGLDLTKQFHRIWSGTLKMFGWH
jgi:hypothetical protein